MIKTEGKEKNYELIEYVNDVNREYAEVLMELNINGIMDTAYTYGNERLTNERFTGWTGYYTYDPRGSVSGVTDSEGMIWQSYRYDGYGNISFGKLEYNNVYSYNAESYNPNVDVQYLRARYYCPTTADFLTEDTYLGNISDPLTLNRYNYVKSSPLNYVDSSGHLPITPDTAFDAVSWLLSTTEFLMAPSVSTGLSLAWDTFAVLAPGVPSVGLMDEMAEFTIKETGETITKKALMEAAEEASERVARDGIEAGMKYADELSQADKCANVEDIEHLLLNVSESGTSSGKYQVGAYQDIKGVEGLDAHHVGQKAAMKNLVENYDPKTAPAINVPKVGHTISGPNGIVSRNTKGIDNARQLLARDLFELKRVYPDIPNSAYQELIDMNMKMYPEMRK